MVNFQDKVSFIWSIAELLRGDYNLSDYGKVTLPLAVLRRLDCALEPTKDETAEICPDAKGNPEPDPDLRDFENVPFWESIETYFARHFYKYKALRPLEEIDAESRLLETEIQAMLVEVLG